MASWLYYLIQNPLLNFICGPSSLFYHSFFPQMRDLSQHLAASSGCFILEKFFTPSWSFIRPCFGQPGYSVTKSRKPSWATKRRRTNLHLSLVSFRCMERSATWCVSRKLTIVHCVHSCDWVFLRYLAEKHCKGRLPIGTIIILCDNPVLLLGYKL